MSSSPADVHAWCFDHGCAHVFSAGTTPWCSAAWVGFVADSAAQALEAKQAAYGGAQFFDQLSAGHQLGVIEICESRSQKPTEPNP